MNKELDKIEKEILALVFLDNEIKFNDTAEILHRLEILLEKHRELSKKLD